MPNLENMGGSSKEEPLIKIETPIGASGRKVSNEEITKSKNLLERLAKDKEIEKKREEGKLLSQGEAARKREKQGKKNQPSRQEGAGDLSVSFEKTKEVKGPSPEELELVRREERKKREAEAKEKEPLIKIGTSIGDSGRKISKKVVVETKNFLERLNADKEIERKIEKGELLFQGEAARIREKEINARGKRRKKETKEEVVKNEPSKQEGAGDLSVPFEKAEGAKDSLPKELELAIREEKTEEEKRIGRGEAEKKGEKPTPEAEKPADKAIEGAIGVKPEKSRAETLADKREVFVRAELNARAQLSLLERIWAKVASPTATMKKKIEEVGNYKKTKEEYLSAMADLRAEMIEKYGKENGAGLSGKQQESWLKARRNEILKETVVREANNLYDTKMRLQLEAKGGAGFAEKSWKFAGRMVEGYRKLPTKYKLLISAGLLAGGAIAGSMAGASGAVLLTGVVTGRLAQRIFGGAATAVGAEALMHRSQEKHAEKKTLNELGSRLERNLIINNARLDERLLELAGRKQSEKVRRYVLAGALGGVIASGLAAKAIRDGIGFFWPGGTGPSFHRLVTEAHGHLPDNGMSEAPIGASGGAEHLVSGVETVGQGDSVWKLAGHQLSQRLGDQFNGLGEAQKTALINEIKNRIASDPKAFGLTDVDQLKIGQEIDFSKIFEDKGWMDKIIQTAGGLKGESIKSILDHNKILAEWVKAHPGSALTSGRAEEILRGGGGSVHEATAGTTASTIDPSHAGTPGAGGNYAESAVPETPINEMPSSAGHGAGLHEATVGEHERGYSSFDKTGHAKGSVGSNLYQESAPTGSGEAIGQASEHVGRTVSIEPAILQKASGLSASMFNGIHSGAINYDEVMKNVETAKGEALSRVDKLQLQGAVEAIKSSNNPSLMRTMLSSRIANILAHINDAQ